MNRYGIRVKVIVFDMNTKNTVHTQAVESIIVEAASVNLIKALASRIVNQINSVFSIISWNTLK